jgi:hypothetical protein
MRMVRDALLERRTSDHNFISDFNGVMEQWKGGRIEDAEAVLMGVQVLKMFFYTNHVAHGDRLFDIDTFENALEATSIGKQRRTWERRLLQGCLCFGLVVFGSSNNQARKLMIDYEGITETAAKTAYRTFKNYANLEPEEMSMGEFVESYSDWITDLVDMSSRATPFGDGYSDAAKAYMALLGACEESKLKKASSKYRAELVRPYAKLGSKPFKLEFGD